MWNIRCVTCLRKRARTSKDTLRRRRRRQNMRVSSFRAPRRVAPSTPFIRVSSISGLSSARSGQCSGFSVLCVVHGVNYMGESASFANKLARTPHAPASERACIAHRTTSLFMGFSAFYIKQYELTARYRRGRASAGVTHAFVERWRSGEASGEHT